VVEKEGSKKEEKSPSIGCKMKMDYFALQNGLFWMLKWIVLRFKTIHFQKPYFIGLEAIVLKEGKKRNKNTMIEKKR
jgi:hypothetical protein